MKQSLDQFIAEISASGLAPEGELRAAVSSVGQGDEPCDAEQLARELVRRGLLTPYQLQQIHLGQAKSLTIGNYVVLDKLGQGGMGVVLKARHKRMDRLVALKMLSPATVGSPDAVERFHREVRAAARLIHPNIVTAFDADEANGAHFFAMEYVEGCDLSRLVKQQGPLSVAAAVRYVLQAARGLAYAHEQGIVHRDIKPSNLLLDGKGNVKILDMGLARIESAAGVQAELTGSGQIMGTVDYMSPEQALNTRKADQRADIYSLGITLWFLLTGRAAYDGETVMERMMAHQSSPIPSLAAACAGVSPSLDAVFQKMVAKNVGDRFQSMDEVIAALERCRGGDFSATTSFRSSDGISRSSGSGTRNAPNSAGSILASAGSGTAADEFDATINTGGGQIDTDPETQTHIRAPGSLPPKDLEEEQIPVWKRPLALLMGGLLGVLAIGVVVAIVLRSNLPAQIEIPKGGSATLVTSPESTEWALDFDGKSTYVELPKLNLPEKFPITIEAIVTPRNQSSGMIVVTPDHIAGSLFHYNNKWFARGWATGSPTFVDAGGLNVVPGRRVHLACTWDGKAAQVYVDGQPGTGELDVKVQPIPQKLAIIGCGIDSRGKPSWVFNGLIHQVRFSKGLRYTNNSPVPARMEWDLATIALYNCEEGAGNELRDHSPNGLDGRIVGAKWVKVNKSATTASVEQPSSSPSFPLEFDGVDDHVHMPDFQLKNARSLTLEVIVTPDSNPARLVAIAAFTGKAVLWDDKGTPSFNLRVEAPAAAPVIGALSPFVPKNEVHLAGVWDGKEITFYVDGKRQGLPQPCAGVFNSVLPFSLGATPNGNSPFRGRIRGAHVTAKVKYTGAFDPPSTLSKDDGTLALYEFREGKDGILHDTSGNGHDGTIVGAKWVPASRMPDPLPSEP